MTISSSTNKYQYSGSGTTGPFNVTDLEAQSSSQLEVTKTDTSGNNTTLTLTTDYTVNSTITEVTLVDTLDSGETLTITLTIPATQETDYKNTSTLNAETIETALDKLTLMRKEDKEEGDRSVKFTIDSTATPEVPNPSGNGGSYLRLNSAEDNFEYATLTSGSAIAEVVDDPSPQLGGNLDPNGNHIATDAGLEILKFTETSSAVNEVTVANAATGSGPTISATGDDTNVDLNIASKGTGAININGTDILELILPTGSVVPYAGTSAPTNFLLCYGQAVSRTTYADLFTVISTTYGVGDGSTTFNLPDLRGRAVAGKDDMGGSSANRLTDAHTNGINGDTLGDTGGSEEHTLVTSEMPSHSHTSGASDTGNDRRTEATISSNTSTTSGLVNNSSTGTGSTGSDGAHNNVQPTIILNYIIRT